MRIHHDWTGLPADARGASVAMGNFDGVHLGHRSVIDTARAACDAPLGIITFEPHPREFFAGDADAADLAGRPLHLLYMRDVALGGQIGRAHV